MLLPFSSVDLLHASGQVAYLRLLKDCSQQQQQKYDQHCLLEDSLVFVCNEEIVAEVLAYPVKDNDYLNKIIRHKDREKLLQIRVKLVKTEFLPDQLIPLLLMASLVVWEQKEYQQVFYKIQEDDHVSDFLNIGFSYLLDPKGGMLDDWIIRGMGSFHQERTLMIVQGAINNGEQEQVSSSIVRQIQLASDNADEIVIVQSKDGEHSSMIHQAIDEARAMDIICRLYEKDELIFEKWSNEKQNRTIILTGIFKDLDHFIHCIQSLTHGDKCILIPVQAIQIVDGSQDWMATVDVMGKVTLLQDDFCLDV